MTAPEYLHERQRAAEAQIVATMATLGVTELPIEPYPTDAVLQHWRVVERVYTPDPLMDATMRLEWMANTLAVLAAAVTDDKLELDGGQDGN